MASNVFHNEKGFVLVEVILTTVIFILFVAAFVTAIIYGQENTVLAAQRMQAILYAEEGLEAVRNIRDEEFDNLTNGTYGLSQSGGEWVLSGSSDVQDIYTRQIVISDGGVKRKDIEVTVTWQQNTQRQGEVVLTSRLSEGTH